MSENPDQVLIDALAARRDRQGIIIAAYEAMRPKDRRAAALAIWRCKQDGCTLVYVWRSPMGTLFYQPRFTSSPTENARNSNEAGRARNTFDGDNHWKPSAGVLDDLRAFGDEAGIFVQCGHIPRTKLYATDLFPVIDAAKPGRPTTVMV